MTIAGSVTVPRSSSPRSAPRRPPSKFRAAGWSAAPRPQPQQQRPTDHVVRHLALPRLHADLKGSALAHLPSVISSSARFAANAAWLVLGVMAFNLTRAATTLTGARLARAGTATIRRTLVTVPARIASSARRLTLHLPRGWPWESAWHALFHNLFRRYEPIIA